MMLRFGTNLEYLRKLNKMEQKDVAKIVNKSVSTISAWERAKREPTVADVYLLALYFKVDIEMMYRALFILLYSTGLRSGEALALTWADIDFDQADVSVTKTVNTKMGKPIILPPKTKSSIRTIRAPKKTLDALLEYREQVIDHPCYSPSAFVFGLDRPIPNSTLQNKKHKYCSMLPDLEEIRLHSFRHSTASNLIHSGKLSVVFISKYLGHSSVKETLDTYAHFFPSETDVVADVMDDIL